VKQARSLVLESSIEDSIKKLMLDCINEEFPLGSFVLPVISAEPTKRETRQGIRLNP
jgi:hypothetical protein